MIKDFPHYSNATMRAALKVIRGTFGYKGEAFWWHLLEWLNQNDTEPIDWSDDSIRLLTCEYIHPLQHDPEERQKEVEQFLNFCSSYKDKAGVALIDTEMWNNEKKIWSQTNSQNQGRVLKRRKQKVDVPDEVVEFVKQMCKDVNRWFSYVKETPKWKEDLFSLVKDNNPTLEEAKRVWYWLQNSSDSDAVFWRKNIRSPKKFKEQFPALEGFSRKRMAATKLSIFDR